MGRMGPSGIKYGNPKGGVEGAQEGGWVGGKERRGEGEGGVEGAREGGWVGGKERG